MSDPESAAEPSRLVVIEDDDAIRRLLIQTLEDDGHHVRSADDGESGLALLWTVDPHLIVLDVRLPGMNGYEFVHRYRSEHPSPADVLLLSASPPPDQWPEGIASYLRKPFDLDELSTTVQRLLETRTPGPR